MTSSAGISVLTAIRFKTRLRCVPLHYALLIHPLALLLVLATDFDEIRGLP
jgi:hypothetical protein